MKKNLLEPGLILFAVLTLFLLYGRIPFAERLLVISFSSLALYYLLSGALVLFNRQVAHPIRLLYFFGLWSISMGILGAIYIFRFWPNGKNLLMLAFAISTATMMILLLYQVIIKKNVESIRMQLAPLFKRLLIYPVIFLVLQVLPFEVLFSTFNRYRENEAYREALQKTMVNPADSAAQKRVIKMEKLLENGNKGATEEGR